MSIAVMFFGVVCLGLGLAAVWNLHYAIAVVMFGIVALLLLLGDSNE